PAAVPSGSSTLSLHDALPILDGSALAHAVGGRFRFDRRRRAWFIRRWRPAPLPGPREQDRHPDVGPAEQHIDGVVLTAVDQRERSEEHTSELQSRENLVCRLL